VTRCALRLGGATTKDLLAEDPVLRSVHQQRSVRRIGGAMRAIAALLVTACSATAPVPASHPPETLAFHLREGAIDNYFYQRGPVAAHLLVTSGAEPRILIAFPAGNEGIGLWFERGEPAELAVTAPIASAGTGAMHGINAQLSVSRALVVKQAALAGVRTLRDYMALGTIPPELAPSIEAGPPVALRRTTLDGKHHLSLELAGAVRVDGDAIVFSPGTITLTALLDETPLTPIETTGLLDVVPPGHDRELHALAFLAYREKLLAGSWRFLTYFGRDTLLTVRLLMSHARPELIEAGLGAVLDRLDPTGDVAHEEDIGDFAAWENHRPDEAPRFDYKMIDDDFLLAPVLASYVAASARGPGFVAAHADAISHNLERVLRLARPYAAQPTPANLIHLRDTLPVGNWRDSERGLGGGRIPYDVNAALVPAALAAAARLYRLPALGADQRRAVEAERLAAVWSHAIDAFRVEVSAADARREVAAYAAQLGLDDHAVASIDGPVALHALALDGNGRPIPIMNTDDGFVLLFGEPSPVFLEEVVAHITQPFPAGLYTPVGLVVANPVFAPGPLQRQFTRADYHGTVIWSWQQALLAEGIERQLARRDLPDATRAKLAVARQALWRAIRGAAEMSTSELWSWRVDAGTWHVVPFGQGAADADESDAVQLWSTVYLAVPPP
jgi:hypothetical protein